MTQDTEAKRPLRRFAVYSPTGVHIGLWGDGKIAADVAAESPGNTIEELIAADEYEALRSERDALRHALGHIDAMDPESMIDGFSENAVRGLVLQMGSEARAALGKDKP